MLQEFKKFVKGILFWLCLLIVFSFLFFLPVPAMFKTELLTNGQSITVYVFENLKSNFLPAEVELIVTNPISAFLTQVTISLALSLIVLSPLILWRVIRYLSPALFEKEKRAVIKTLIPSALLFFVGCLFAYFLLIPSTLKLLYPFAAQLGASQFFLVNEFIYLIFGIMIATGVMFLLPVFMVLLGRMGLVEPGFWKANWRYSLLIFLVFSAIITPDGTGITMAMLSIPLMTLYSIGIFATVKLNRSK